jgi:hypothetical protein
MGADLTVPGTITSVDTRDAMAVDAVLSTTPGGQNICSANSGTETVSTASNYSGKENLMLHHIVPFD